MGAVMWKFRIMMEIGFAIFEVKYSRRLEDLPYDCERAIKQIDVDGMGKNLQGLQYHDLLWDRIYRKRCMVKVQSLPLPDHPTPNHNPRIPSRLADAVIQSAA